MDQNHFVNLKLDIVFKSFFANKKNEHLLLDFLSSILDIPIEEIDYVEVKNPEVPVESLRDKFSRMDLNLSVSGRNINIEMQVESEEAYKERAVYYWSKLFQSLKQGESYNELPETIAIHILNHNLFECETYQSGFRFYEENRHELLTDKCGIFFFELPKVSSELNVENKKELWLNLIKADSNERYDEIANTGSDIMSEAVKVIYNMSDDTRIREAARQRQKSLYDKYSSLTLAERRGRKKAAEIYESQLAKKDDMIAENQAQLAQNKAQLAEKDSMIAEKDSTIAENKAQLAQNKAQIAEKDGMIAEKDDEIAQLKAMLKQALAQLNQK